MNDILEQIKTTLDTMNLTAKRKQELRFTIHNTINELKNSKNSVYDQLNFLLDGIEIYYAECLSSIPQHILQTKVKEFDGDLNVVQQVFDDYDLTFSTLSIEANKYTDHSISFVDAKSVLKAKQVNNPVSAIKRTRSTNKENKTKQLYKDAIAHITKVKEVPTRPLKKNEKAKVLFVSYNGSPLSVGAKIENKIQEVFTEFK